MQLHLVGSVSEPIRSLVFRTGGVRGCLDGSRHCPQIDLSERCLIRVDGVRHCSIEVQIRPPGPGRRRTRTGQPTSGGTSCGFSQKAFGGQPVLSRQSDEASRARRPGWPE